MTVGAQCQSCSIKNRKLKETEIEIKKKKNEIKKKKNEIKKNKNEIKKKKKKIKKNEVMNARISKDVGLMILL